MTDLTKARSKPELLLRRGSFKCAYNTELVILLFFVALVSLFVLWAMSALTDLPAWAAAATDIGEVYLAVFDILMGFVWAFLSMGRECAYEALETEFVVRGPGKRYEIFYYSDIADITFDKWRRRGYVVKITTGVRTITYRCIFGENKVDTEITGNPFYYLAVNSGLMRPRNVSLADGEEVLTRFGYMQARQALGEDEEDNRIP